MPPTLLRLLLTLTIVFSACRAAAVPALDDNLLAHLPFKTDLRDHSGAKLSVDLSGHVELRDGAAYFGGERDWLELPFIPLNERPFTIAVWLKPTGTEPTYGVLEQRDHNQRNHILHLMIREGLHPWFGFYVNDVVSPVSLSNAGGWQHVVFRYDGANQEIWINAHLVCQRAAKPYLGTAGKTCVGKNPNWNNVPARDYEGYMSDFRIYGRPLAFEEVVALASTPPASSSPAQGLSRIEQPAGSVAPAGASDRPLLAINAEKMRLQGKPGEEYVVEVSSDLQSWHVLGNVSIGPEGLVDLVDEEAPRLRQRFYRIRYRLPQ